MANDEKYTRKGQAQGAIGAVIALIVGVGVAVLIMIFVGALGGQTYNLVEADIDDITNTTVRDAVKNSIISSFEALQQTGDYLPIVVLAFIIALVLTLVLGFGNIGGGMGGRGSVL